MDQNLTQLQGALQRLARRERLLLAVQILLVGTGGVLLAWGGMAALATAAIPPRQVRAAGTVAGLLGGGALGVWGLWTWRRAGSLLRQARAMEGVRPALRARLLTLVERFDGPRPGDSETLLGLVAVRATALLEGMLDGDVHPVSDLKRGAFVAVLGAALWGGLQWQTEPGPLGLWDWLEGGGQLPESAQGTSPMEDGPRAVVGDIHLRYAYPEYTGLAPLEVPNSNGLAHGPPGTRVEVQARTDRPFDGARLAVLDDPPTDIELEGGRDLSGAFQLTREGTWRFLLREGEVEIPSLDFPIEIEPDNPPTVDLESSLDRLEVAWDQRIPVQWSARDDFGIERVGVTVQGREVVLRAPLDAVRNLQGDLNRTPEELGLAPGDEVELTLQAWDNDDVGGSKAGASRAIQVVVLGPKASKRRTVRLWRELRDALVDLLAGYATELVPPARTQRELVVWGGEAAERFDPMDSLVDKYWDAFDVGTVEGVIVEELQRLGGSMLRFVSAVADPRSREPVRAEDLDTVVQLRDELVERGEEGVHVLDAMLRMQALGRVNELSGLLASAAVSLEARAAVEVIPHAEIRSWLDTIARHSVQLRAAAEEFDAHGLTELVVRSLDEAGRIRERMVESMADGNDERTRVLAGYLGDVLEQLLAGVEHMRREAEEDGEEMEDMLKKFREKLMELEAGERDLLSETRQAREELGEGQESLVELWEAAERLAGEALKHAELASRGVVVEAGFSAMEEALAAQGAIQSARLFKVVGARDLVGSRDQVGRALLRLGSTRRTVTQHEAVREAVGASPPTIRQQLGHLEVGVRRTRELDHLLEQLDGHANDAPPGLISRALELDRVQQELETETVGAEPTAHQIAQELPMGAPGLEEGLAGAVREIGRSRAALQGGRTVEAEGAEGAAAERLLQAREALEQAAAAMQQMRDAMEQAGQRGGSGEGGSGGSEGLARHTQVEIPPPEEFETPEAYRRALLEGMKGEVPPEYEALKRRYYEELVRQ